jgi:hypothetical protein
MDEIRRDAARWGASPDLRVSDAERDAVVTELGQHFQQGRLDQEEFDQRVTTALSARTGGDLGKVLTDLPAAREEFTAPQPARPLPRFLFLIPLAAAVLIVGAAVGGGHRGWEPWPLWWLVPIIVVLRFGWWRRNWRGRRWQ